MKKSEMCNMVTTGGLIRAGIGKTQKDINRDRPNTVGNINTERKLNTRYQIDPCVLSKRCYVREIAVYEMSGDCYEGYESTAIEAWAESDLTGAYWLFENEGYALKFIISV